MWRKVNNSYNKAGTLFYNTHPNELINAYRGGQRQLRPSLRSKGQQMSTQSVPNIHQMSSIEPPADYPGSNPDVRMTGTGSGMTGSGMSGTGNSTRTESLQRRRSMSHHEVSNHVENRRLVSQPVYTTIGQYQGFPKLIQVSIEFCQDSESVKSTNFS